MFGATVFLVVGMGLLSTLRWDSRMALILGYQVPAGAGLGLALQQTVLAAQTMLPMDDIPIGVSLIVLAQTLGGTISLSAADTIFTTSLSSGIAKAVPQLDRSTTLNAGATTLRNLIPPEYLDTVLAVYNGAAVNTWYLSLALACASVFGVAGMEWKRIKPAAKSAADAGSGSEPATHGGDHRDGGSESTLHNKEQKDIGSRQEGSADK